MTNFSTTYSFWWVFICILVGAGYAWLQYSRQGPWNKRLNYLLTALRFLAVSIACFLMLEPVVQTIENYSEKPLIVLAIDNSESISLNYSDAELTKLKTNIGQVGDVLGKRGYELKMVDGKASPIVRLDSMSFLASTTNLSEQLSKIRDSYLERNLAGVVLFSDGIFNEGYSPLAIPGTIPVYTIGLGDTTSIKDLSLKDVVHNSTVYEGNSLQLEVQALNTHMGKVSTKVKIYQNGKVVDSNTISFDDRQSLLKQIFTIPITGSGKQSLKVELEPVDGEYTQLNNASTIYFEVINARKRILILASAPHPDIKAIKNSIEQNEYYEVELAYELPQKLDYELIITHQFPSQFSRRLDEQRLLDAKIPQWIIAGRASDFRYLDRAFNIISKDNFSGKDDFVRPVWSSGFNLFGVEEDFLEWISDLPPITTPYGLSYNLINGQTMLYRQIGNVVTTEPLLLFSKNNEQNLSVLMGTGIWKWKLDEYRQGQTQKNFNELISRTVQYLSSDATQKRFYVTPQKDVYEEGEEVDFLTEQYNALFERIIGNKVILSIRKENGGSLMHSYVPLTENYDFKVSDLKEGVYSYRAESQIDSVDYTSQGQFIVKKLNKEALNPVADFDVLQRLAAKTNATFTPYNKIESFINEVEGFDPVSTLHSSEKENLLINIKWVLVLLFLLVFSEWFLRKFYGGY